MSDLVFNVAAVYILSVCLIMALSGIKAMVDPPLFPEAYLSASFGLAIGWPFVALVAAFLLVVGLALLVVEIAFRLVWMVWCWAFIR